MRKLSYFLLALTLCCGVAVSSMSCRNAGKAAKELSKKIKPKPKKDFKPRPIHKTCSECGRSYTGFDCPYCD